MRWLPYFQGVDGIEQAMAGWRPGSRGQRLPGSRQFHSLQALSLLLGSYTCYCDDNDIRPALSSEEFCH